MFSENKRAVLGLFLEIPRSLVEELELSCRQRMSGLYCEQQIELDLGTMHFYCCIVVKVGLIYDAILAQPVLGDALRFFFK